MNELMEEVERQWAKLSKKEKDELMSKLGIVIRDFLLSWLKERNAKEKSILAGRKS